MEKGEIIMYQPDESIMLEVWLENETVWLTQAQMAILFSTTKQNVSLHIHNIFKEKELSRSSVVKDFLTTAADGKQYKTLYYNLDVIISVGYRVKSFRGTRFRQWANTVLKDYLLRGYAVNHRLEQLEQKVAEHDAVLSEHTETLDFFVRTSLPPKEGIFYDGQIFDAHTFVSDLVRAAQKSIVLIDNYVDDTVLKTLAKRTDGVGATIITRHISEILSVDLQCHNQQYSPISIWESDRYHDRFLIIDDTVYHLGASLKDLGKKLFAFNRMEIKAELLVANEKTRSV
ncbi:MAG: virulence RhuM family protein [Bacteroidales bacterium]|nr:virulence RhuM family protein [Bacteroidales bacterium]